MMFPACSGNCRQGRALCPHPKDCGVDEIEAKPMARRTEPTRPLLKGGPYVPSNAVDSHIAERFDAYRSIVGTLPKDDEGETA